MVVGLSLPIVLLALVFPPPRLPVAARDSLTRLTPTSIEIREALRTDWYGVYMLGKKLGYSKDTVARLPDAKNPGFVTSTELVAKTVSMGAKTELRIVETEEFDGKPPYALRRAKSSTSDGKSVQEIEVVRTARGYEVVVTAAGEQLKKQLDALDYTFSDVLTPYLWIRRGAKAGDKLTSQSFDLTDRKMDKQVRKLLSTTNGVANGVKVHFHDVEFTSLKDKLSGRERYDQKGNLLSGTLGVVFETRLEPEQKAKDVSYQADLFVLGTVKVDKALGSPSEVIGLVLEVAGKEASILKSGPRQTIEKNAAGKYICKLGKGYAMPAPASKEEIAENLEETHNYLTTHPRIRALMQQAVGNAKTPEEKVRRLVQFVSDFIKPDYKAEPMTLLDLLKVKKGDCKHYALLLTTLARAAGIPAREVHGLLYLGDEQKAFGGHAWTEVVLNGQWVPVDAAWGEMDINATHLCFGSGFLDDLSWVSTFGKLSFKVVEVKHK
jgi:hypothetical protein